jgi:GNAT superfamily N-acetyltransferase
MMSISAPVEGAQLPARTPAPPKSPRTRALDFQAAIEDALATRVEESEHGAAVFRDDLPRVTELNVLRIRGKLAGGLDAAGLFEAADEVQAGLPHRAIRMDDPVAGAALAPEFAAAGWVVARTELMVLRRRPDRPIDVSAVTETAVEDIRRAREAAIRRRHRDLELVDEAVRAGELHAGPLALRAVAAIVGSEVAAYCLLCEGYDTAKLTEVFALERARGHGVGLAVIAAAADAARRAGRPGATLAFVESLPDEWVKSVYHRLGFDEFGAVHRFVRPWGDEGRLPPPL